MWKHMTDYVENLASVFQGVRLDNSHSTPIHVAQYLIRKGLAVNPNLLVMAELFAGTREKEIQFINKIGINILVRECIWAQNSTDLATTLHKYGGAKEYMMGKVDERIQLNLHINDKIVVKSNFLLFYIVDCAYLHGMSPISIIYDCTHDNPTYSEKFKNLNLNLSMIALAGSSLSSVATTRGFDQLFPYQPSVVKEDRLYCYDADFEKLLNSSEIFRNEEQELYFEREDYTVTVSEQSEER